MISRAFVLLALTRSDHNVVGAAIGLIILTVFLLWNWRKLSTQCVEREFTYRRLFGKWRWER